MICPKCDFENPDEVKFCVECGAKLEIVCPKCGCGNAPSYKFCGECGQRLVSSNQQASKDLSFAEKFDKIQRYLPKGLTDKILAQKKRIEGERKVVTIMFCDMKGFTPLTEKLGPEETFSFMDKVFEIFIHKVHEYEGIVNEMRGDGILAFFGVPITLEDAPQRAIRAAYAIHRAMIEFNETIIGNRDVPPVLIRIGINTGEVVVGSVGNDLRVQFTAVGDTINMASRVENLAEPGTTYVTEDTFKLTEGFFRFEALGEKEIKGKTDPIKVYRVIAPNARRARFDVSAERGLTPFVGRSRELELLLDGFDRVKNGRGQAFSIVSEAGQGKSRLLYEFRKAVANENVTFLEGKCLSYSRSVAYHPVIDILKSNFELLESDGESKIIKKVQKGLKDIEVDEDVTLPYLLDLLSVKASGIDELSMSPESRKERTTEAVKRISLKGAEVRPLIIAIEDLHWIDKGSEDYFKDLLDHISGTKIFLIFTYRPEFDPSWSGRSYHNQVTLNRLSNRESNAMVTSILDTAEIDSDLEELIFEKTEGVPFFIEEFLKSFKDLNIIEKKGNAYYLRRDSQKVSIPFTINEVVMARVDALGEGAKDVLQAGSAIEREFSFELIMRATGYSEENLLSYLSALRDSELIYERGIYPESTYIFKHALTREVIYELILSEKKKMLHDKIGNAIEILYNENIHEYYGVLVKHFIESGNYKKAAEYSRLAGNRAEVSASFPDAIEYCKKRIACLENFKRTEETQKKIIDARTKLGYYFIRMDYFADAKKPIDAIVDLARKYDYKSKLVEIISIIGIYQWSVEEDYQGAIESLNEALDIADQTNDVSLPRFPNYWLGVAYSFMCEFVKSLDHFKKALDIALIKNTPWDISVVKSCLSYFVFAQQGNISLAHERSLDALQIAEKTDDVFPKTFVYSNYGLACYTKGLVKEGMENLIKGIQFCDKIDMYIWNAFTHFYLGEIYYDLGNYEKSKECYAKSIILMERNRTMPSWIILNRICLAKAQVMNNEKNIDIESLYEYESSNKVELYSGLMRRSICETLLNIDNQHIAEAEKWIKMAINADTDNGKMWFLGRNFATYYDLLNRKGSRSEATKCLDKAIKIFRECGADGWVEKYEKELATQS